MANLQVKQTQRAGRTYITIEATPKSRETKALLRAFTAQVKAIETTWRGTVAAKAAAAASKPATRKKRAR